MLVSGMVESRIQLIQTLFDDRGQQNLKSAYLSCKEQQALYLKSKGWVSVQV